MRRAVCESCGPLPLSPHWPPGTTKFNHEHGTGHRVRLKEDAMTTKQYPTYRLDLDHHAGSERMRRMAGSRGRFIIVSGEERPWPVIEHRSSGQATYLIYRSHQKARTGLARVKTMSQLPEVRIYDLDAQAP